jgi:23S rRNA pseudouridine1911/1915/1917 synthase
LKTTVKVQQTIFEFLLGQYPDSPRTRVKKLLQSGTVRVNNRPVTLHSYKVNPGDEVTFSLHPGVTSKISLPYTILFEDNDIIAIEKPAGISTSSVDGSASIQKVVSGYLRDKSKGAQRSHVVHRLDKEVSGVLVIAKTEEIMDQMKEKWDETEKHYYAFVEGGPEHPEGTIRSYLVEGPKQKMLSVESEAEGKLAITHYTTIKKVNANTLLDIRTETGRKNQIRVHLSELGCPIIGDRKYGASDEYVRRVRLHAYSLSFPHPVTGKVIKLESPMPEGFLSLKLKDEKYK